MTVEQVQTLVRHWQERLGVTVSRVQVRKMRNKWGSISTAGTLTLADDILHLPQDLAEYVVVHELLHLKFPDHRQVWQVSMGMYLPDWREREQRLQGYVGPAIG
ncbi:MAG: M48 family metallopeptidase [Caldilineaceae bacterium]|nr:M48 family metallopeptidase [Caldilineaceae bacterium]